MEAEFFEPLEDEIMKVYESSAPNWLGGCRLTIRLNNVGHGQIALDFKSPRLELLEASRG